MQTTWNFLEAQTGIVDRIKVATQPSDGSGWARLVGTRKELSAVAEEMQVTPAVYVVYDGFAVLAGSDEYSLQLSHRWLVVLAIGNAASQREAAALDQEAGPHLGELIKALHGYKPPQCNSPLVMSTPPRPFYSPAKFAYYPLLFTVSSVHC
ncbi:MULTISPECIES: hypothetical protein [Comamonas]|uniref:phage tail terminator protein n=1 Tax=Comamonas TaxID=283 RepID=UPI0001DA68D3|nr:MULTISPECIES: hypothetical protein [Comamonas]EFI60749.1 hypothetical protein CTS44_15043 [Comamonas thiooxydans]TFF63115.1 hypothetical protein EIC84_03460 [Comamonas sp. A23]